MQHMKLINVIHNFKRIKGKKHIIISVDSEKAFWQTPTPFHDKTLNKIGVEGVFLNIIKSVYEKCTTYITLSGKGLKTFLPGWRTRQGRLPAASLQYCTEGSNQGN